MKKILKRTAAWLSSGALLLSLAVVPTTGEAAQHFVFYDDFETETAGEVPSQWQIDAAGKAVTAEAVTEGGNTFMRITAKEGGDSSKNRPTVQTKEGLVAAQLAGQTKKIVVEADMRTQNSSMRKSLRLGYTTNDWDANQYNLFAFRNAAGNFTYLNGSVFDGSATQTSLATLDGFTNDPTAWYSVKAVIDPTTHAVDFTLVNKNNNARYTATGKMDSPEYNALNVIGSLNFRFVTAQVGEAMDVDNCKVYYVYPAPTATLISDGGSLPANVKKIGIRFSERIDTDTLTETSVQLKNAAGAVTTCTVRSYDEATNTYYITPDEELTVGETYEIVLDDGIYAANGGDYYIDGQLIGEHSFSFSVTPAKSSDATLKSLSVNGLPVLGFDAAVTEYTASIEYAEDVAMPVVSAAVNDEKARMNIEYPSTVGEDIRVIVTAEDGVTECVYTIHVNLVGEVYAKLGPNLISNEGFEEGSLIGYSPSSDKWNGFQLVTDVVHSGSYAALCTNRTDSSYHYLQKVNVEAGKTYLLSGWFRLRYSSDAGTAFEVYPAGEVNRPYRDEEKVSGSADEWRQVVLTAETTADGQLSPSVQCWSADVDYYVDDLFIGELKPVIRYNGADSLEVDANAQQSITLSADLVNQLGTKNGLKYSAISGYQLLSAPNGVSLTDDNKLQIEKDAEGGTILLEISASLLYTGAFDSVLTKQVAIQLTDRNDTTPKAKGFAVSGVLQEGETLTADYHYYQSEGKPEGASEIIWLISDSAESGYEPIEGATGKTYVVRAEDVGRYIRAQVTPRAEDGTQGQPTMSENFICQPTAPVAETVTVIAPDACGVGDVLTGSYRYFDINGDVENSSATQFRWLRSSEKGGSYTAIEGATALTYTLTEDDVDQYLMFEVTPASVNENAEKAFTSAAVCGPMRPYAENVTIEKISSTMLAASYKYCHANQVAEGKTEFRWYIGSSLVGTERTCTFSSLNGVTVKLEVIPVAVKAPFNGEAVSTSAGYSDRAQSYGGSSHSGGGGGGGGASFKGYVPIPTPSAEPTEEPTPSEKPTHWAQAALTWAEENGLMTKGETETPDAVVTRQAFLTYVLNCIGFEPTEYRGGFGDVSAEDGFGDLLQTAVDNGIISEDENFYPQRSVTREEICKIVAAALKAAGSTTADGDISGFGDYAEMSAWAHDYIRVMVGTGLMQGADDGRFMPRGTVTVGQTAAILQRISSFRQQEKAVAEQ